MRTIRYTSQFKKDLKRIQKRAKNVDKLKAVMMALAEGRPIDGKLRDHPLKGVFAEYRECHIEPDWLLVYRLHDTEITFVRTGTHSDLFG